MAMKSTGKVCMKSAESRFCRSFTGDIKTPVKYASRELKKLFSQVEEEMVDTFIKEEILNNIKTFTENDFKKVKMTP